MTLRTRLLVGLTVLVVAAVATSGWVVLAVARLRLQSATESQARLVAVELSRTLAAGDAAAPLATPAMRERLEKLSASLVARGDAKDIAIVDHNRAVVVGASAELARDDAFNTALLLPNDVVLRRHARGWYAYTGLPGANGVRGVARFRFDGDDDVARTLGDTRLLLAAVAGLDAVLVLVFGALFIRRVVGPVTALADAARKVAAGDLDVGDNPALAELGPRRDELSDLAQAFVQMTRSLREHQESLVAQEKLATVGRLAAGVAHEVGNPLAAILGYVDLLYADEKPRAGEAPTERAEMLERIRKETERIRNIIHDLLDYSRPAATTPEPTSLAELCDAAASLVRPQARFRGVTLDNAVARDLPRVAASPRALQILINLFLNAADAMGGEGRIRVEAAVEGDHLALRVSDSGPGVAKADQGRIFDPFFTTKEPGHGTGLGLAVSRSIARAHGGDLVLAHAPTPGATFVLTLPIWKG